jgi:hypothetical protein
MRLRFIEVNQAADSGTPDLTNRSPDEWQAMGSTDT